MTRLLSSQTPSENQETAPYNIFTAICPQLKFFPQFSASHLTSVAKQSKVAHLNGPMIVEKILITGDRAGNFLLWKHKKFVRFQQFFKQSYNNQTDRSQSRQPNTPVLTSTNRLWEDKWQSPLVLEVTIVKLFKPDTIFWTLGRGGWIP